MATAVVVLSKYWYVTDVNVKVSNMNSEIVKPVVTKATSSIPAVITVEAAGNFSERVRQFIIQLGDIRRRTWQTRGVGDWKYQRHSSSVQVLWGAKDDYMDI